MQKMVVLQSGFISPDGPAFITSDDISPEIINTALKLGKPLMERSSPFHYNSELNTLFDLNYNDPKLLANFAYRERLLSALKDAFGQRSFFDWCTIQEKSLHFTMLHVRFMHDTFKAIAEGQRSINIDSWLAMIEAKRIPEIDPDAVRPLKRYFTHEVPHYFQKELAQFISVNDVLVQWTSHVMGFYDLLCFSKIVFGKSYSRRVS